MSNIFFSSYFKYAQVILLRPCLGLVLFGMAVVTHAAQPDADLFGSRLELFSIQLAHSGSMQQSVNRYSTKAGISNPVSNGHKLGGTSSLPAYLKMKIQTLWSASIRWNLTSVDHRASLSPRLRIESRKSIIEIKPTDKSFMVSWSRALN